MLDKVATYTQFNLKLSLKIYWKVSFVLHAAYFLPMRSWAILERNLCKVSRTQNGIHGEGLTSLPKWLPIEHAERWHEGFIHSWFVSLRFLSVAVFLLSNLSCSNCTANMSCISYCIQALSHAPMMMSSNLPSWSAGFHWGIVSMTQPQISVHS